MQYNDRSKLYIIMDERQLISDSLRSLRKYGSTSNNNYNKLPGEFIKHFVSETDTLQGIALKYGVTTEQIRTANKLWTNDSIFLRESLLIPLRNKSLPSTSFSSFESQNEIDMFLNQPADDIQQLDSNNSSSSYKNDDDLDNVSGFLSRIDADIAHKTQQVKVAQNKSVFVFESNDAGVKKRPAMSPLKQQQRVCDADEASFKIPSVVTQNKKLQNSLQRLQDQHEKIFEL